MSWRRRSRQLKSNQMVFPKNAEAAKRIIYEELKQQGIQSNVRLFAELVQEVKDAEWKSIIETFLGRKRFYIIVDGQLPQSHGGPGTKEAPMAFMW